MKRVSVPGVREDFYRLADDNWDVRLVHGVEDAQQFPLIAQLGATTGIEVGRHAQARPEEMHHLAVSSAQHARVLLESWQIYSPGHDA